MENATAWKRSLGLLPILILADCSLSGTVGFDPAVLEYNYTVDDHYSEAELHDNDYWRGHLAFAEGRWDDALSSFNAWDATWDGSSPLDDYDTDLIRTVERRRALGDISPPNVHRIGVLFTRHTILIENGEIVSTSPDVPDEYVSRHKIRGRVLQRIVEALSDGQWTLEFEYIDVDRYHDRATDLTKTDYSQWRSGGYFYESAGRCDSYIHFSTHYSPALGGAGTFEITPDGRVTTPRRGAMRLNAGEHHGFMVWFHEFFHVIENRVGIVPAHAYRDELRSAYPEWTGTSEFSYYIYHFENAIADFGWNNLQFTVAYPFEL